MENVQEEVVVIMPACEAELFKKITVEEPRFTVRAQDITSDIVVHLWARMQLYAQKRAGEGASLEMIHTELYTLLGNVLPADSIEANEKVAGALLTVGRMRVWPTKKIAD